MRFLGLAVCVGLLLSSAGCATSYESNVVQRLLGEGVKVEKVADNLFIVTVTANEFTSRETVQRYAMRRAAEETLAAGYDWFIVSREQDTSRSGVTTVPRANTTTSDVTVTGPGGRMTGTVRSTTWTTQDIPYFMPGVAMLVRAGRGRPPSHGWDAREVVRKLGKR